MAKVMIFIDGSWLYKNAANLDKEGGEEKFKIDFGVLPHALLREIAEQQDRSIDTLDLVRTYYFASEPVNVSPMDKEIVYRQRDFYELLKSEHNYETGIYPIDFGGSRLSSRDREDGEQPPEEKCVDIGVASAVLYNAAIPHAYDIAILVAGDRDYLPALQAVRRLGKRVAIASIAKSCASEYRDNTTSKQAGFSGLYADNVRDFDLILLDDMLEDIRLQYRKETLNCESPFHRGDRDFISEFSPRKGQKTYCPDCRREYSQRMEESRQTVEKYAAMAEEPRETQPGMSLKGAVKNKINDHRGTYAFIQAEDGHEYFFHKDNLIPGLLFDDVMVGMEVNFIVKVPQDIKPGQAIDVSLVD